MTKAQIRQGLQGVINEVCQRDYDDKSINKLQDINEECGNPRWCCYQHNLIDIIKYGDDKAISRALAIYDEKMKLCGEMNAINKMWEATNNLDF